MIMPESKTGQVVDPEGKMGTMNDMSSALCSVLGPSVLRSAEREKSDRPKQNSLLRDTDSRFGSEQQQRASIWESQSSCIGLFGSSDNLMETNNHNGDSNGTTPADYLHFQNHVSSENGSTSFLLAPDVARTVTGMRAPSDQDSSSTALFNTFLDNSSGSSNNSSSGLGERCNTPSPIKQVSDVDCILSVLGNTTTNRSSNNLGILSGHTSTNNSSNDLPSLGLLGLPFSGVGTTSTPRTASWPVSQQLQQQREHATPSPSSFSGGQRIGSGSSLDGYGEEDGFQLSSATLANSGLNVNSKEYVVGADLTSGGFWGNNSGDSSNSSSSSVPVNSDHWQSQHNKSMVSSSLGIINHTYQRQQQHQRGGGGGGWLRGSVSSNDLQQASATTIGMMHTSASHGYLQLNTSGSYTSSSRQKIHQQQQQQPRHPSITTMGGGILGVGMGGHNARFINVGGGSGTTGHTSSMTPPNKNGRTSSSRSVGGGASSNNNNNNAVASGGGSSLILQEDSSVENVISTCCRDILSEAAGRSLKAVELANTLRARVGTDVLAHIRERWGGLLALLERHPHWFRVDRVPKNDKVTLLTTPIASSSSPSSTTSTSTRTLETVATTTGSGVSTMSVLTPGPISSAAAAAAAGGGGGGDDHSSFIDDNNLARIITPDDKIRQSDFDNSVHEGNSASALTIGSAPSSASASNAPIMTSHSSSNSYAAAVLTVQPSIHKQTSMLSSSFAKSDDVDLEHGHQLQTPAPSTEDVSVPNTSLSPDDVSALDGWDGKKLATNHHHHHHHHHLLYYQQQQQLAATRCLHVGNVPANLTEAQLTREFDKFGPLEGMKLITQRNGNRRFAFITFRQVEHAVNARHCMSKLHPWKSAISFAHKDLSGQQFFNPVPTNAVSVDSTSPHSSGGLLHVTPRQGGASASGRAGPGALCDREMNEIQNQEPQQTTTVSSMTTRKGAGSPQTLLNPLASDFSLLSDNSSSPHILASPMLPFSTPTTGGSGFGYSFAQFTGPVNNRTKPPSLLPTSNVIPLSQQQQNRFNSQHPIVVKDRDTFNGTLDNQCPVPSVASYAGGGGRDFAGLSASAVMVTSNAVHSSLVLRRLCDDTYVPTQLWRKDTQLDSPFINAAIEQLLAFGGSTTVSKLRGFLRNRVCATDNLKSVPLKAMLAAYPQYFVVQSNYVTLHPSMLTSSNDTN